MIKRGKMAHKLYEKPADLTDKIKDWPEPLLSNSGNIILQERYLMKDDSRKVIETPKELYFRVANTIASVDSDYGDFVPTETEKEFYEIMANGRFLPNSPTLRGAGLNINLSACYVLPVEDSREGIFRDGLYGAVEVQAHGGGTGFNFSKLRPKRSLIKSTRGFSSGPISFMKIYDKTIGNTIAQGGTRQGANMGILNDNHADIEAFIQCKDIDGEIGNFNLSVSVDDEFMRKVENNEDYFLLDHEKREVKRVNAVEIFNQITEHAWKRGDPGMIFIDTIQKDNPTPNIGLFEATNPCGEQPLLPYESCNLGSMNLAKYVDKNGINLKALEKDVYTAVHFLDNVIDANNYPLWKTEDEKQHVRDIATKKLHGKVNENDLGELVESIVEEFAHSPIDKMVKGNRKIGLGVMGFADMLFALGIQYGSEESFKVAEEVMSFINETSKQASIQLAETRGVFPNWEGSIYDPKSQYFKGRELRLRNATTTTIAPTGTISQIAQVEGGIEPAFAVAYKRRSIFNEKGEAKYVFYVITKEFEKIAKEEGFFTDEFIKELDEKGGSLKNIKKPENISEERWKNLQELFVISHEVPVLGHIKTQATFQKYTDNAVSKTINLEKSATVQDVKDAYMLAYKMGCKGITIYRDESKEGQILTTTKKGNLEQIAGDKRGRDIPGVVGLLGLTYEIKTGCGPLFVTINCDHKGIVEIFENMNPSGGCSSAQTTSTGILSSLGLHAGLNPQKIKKHLGAIRCPESNDLMNVPSCPRGVSQALDFFEKDLEKIKSGYLGPFFKEDKKKEEKETLEKTLDTTNKKNNSEGKNIVDKTICPDCGAILIHSEGCLTCTSCSYSKCG